MKRAREDNTVGIIQRAVKHYGLHVVKGTVKEALKSHPDYPSFKSICDTLTKAGQSDHIPPEQIDHIRVGPLKRAFSR